MKVYFFQPKNFNRTADRTNPFFDPIIEVCERNGIEWRIYNPGRKSTTGYPRSKVRNSRYLRRFVVFFAKYFGRFMKGRTEYEIDRTAGRIWNFLTFGRDRADMYVTIATELVGALPGVGPNARVVDVMHGIFFPGHSDYIMSDGTVSPGLKAMKEREVWVTGEGYRQMFLRCGDDRFWVDGHVKVIGDFCGHAGAALPRATGSRSRLFLSLQINNGCCHEDNRYRYEKTVDFLRKNAPLGVWNGQPVLVKHHPRFANCYDIGPMLNEFPKLQFVSVGDWGALSKDVLVNATIDSTTAFDFAAHGVPTYFILDGGPRDREIEFIWHETFSYPYWGKTLSQLADEARNDASRSAEVVSGWFHLYYAPLDRARILEELGGTKTGDRGNA